MFKSSLVDTSLCHVKELLYITESDRLKSILWRRDWNRIVLNVAIASISSLLRLSKGGGLWCQLFSESTSTGWAPDTATPLDDRLDSGRGLHFR